MPTDLTRPFERAAPTYNFIDDLTWTKGTHTITMGGNLRLVRNDRTSYATRSRATRYGRGIAARPRLRHRRPRRNAYLAALTGNPTIRLTDATNVGRARSATCSASSPAASMTYSYDADGNAAADRRRRRSATSPATSSRSTSATTGA